MEHIRSAQSTSPARTFSGISAGVLACLLVGALDSNAVTPPSSKAAGLTAPNTTVAMAGLKKAQSEAFVENRGQWDAQAQFLARSPGADAWVTERGVVYDFHRFVPDKDAKKDPMDPRGKHEPPAGRRQGHVVRMEFVGGKPSPSKGEGLLEGKYNYFIGNDESKWASNVPRYSEVRSEQVYDGIEARWYFDQGRPRYDLIVAPGADPGKIQMRFEGAKGVWTDGKTLRLSTSLGDVEHRGLFAYQRIDGATTQVPCRFTEQHSTVSLWLEEFDRSKPLIIDPILWSTFLGGSANDVATTVTLDSHEDSIIAGLTSAINFPAVLGAYDNSHNGEYDGYIAKLAATDSSLLWATYIGGAYFDAIWAVAVDSNDHIFVAGDSHSGDFPCTTAAYDTVNNADVFVAKLKTNGDELLFSTFFGGNNGVEHVASLRIDMLDTPWIAGTTDGNDLPTSVGSFDQTRNGGGGSRDGFVANLSSDGTTLNYGTYIGGTEDDVVWDIDIDLGGNVIIVGESASSDFPTTPGALSETAFANEGAFVTKLTPDLSALVFGTYLPGAAQILSVATDSIGNAVVGGHTALSYFPTTNGAFDTSYNGGLDGFLAKVSADGSSLLFASFVGGAGRDSINCLQLDSLGNVIVAGDTTSQDLPSTAGASDVTYNGGPTSGDAFVAKISGDCSTMIYCTYIGGTGDDWTEPSNSLTVGSIGRVTVGGNTLSSDFPTSDGGYDETINGALDAFIVKLNLLSEREFLSTIETSKSSVVGGYPVPSMVALNYPAPPGGIEVGIASDNKKIMGPSRAVVKAGATSKTFNIKTYTVLTQTICTLMASYGGMSKSVSITLKPGGLQSFKVSLPSFTGGTTVVGTVLLSAPAPSGGRNVALTSSSVFVQVPAAVTVPQGQSSCTFPITSTATPMVLNVSVTAKAGLVKKTVNLTVNP